MLKPLTNSWHVSLLLDGPVVIIVCNDGAHIVSCHQGWGWGYVFD